MTIKELEKKIQDANSARDQMAREQEDALFASRELKRQADDAAAAGDVDGYLKFKNELDRQEAVFFVRKTQLERSQKVVTDAEISDAWDSFAKGYNKNLASKQAEFEKLKKAALSAYREMVDLQRDALIQRQKLADLAGVTAISMGSITPEFERRFPMDYIDTASDDQVTFRVGGLGVLDPDLAMYLDSMGHNTMMALCQDTGVHKILTVVKNHCAI